MVLVVDVDVDVDVGVHFCVDWPRVMRRFLVDMAVLVCHSQAWLTAVGIGIGIGIALARS